MYQGRNCRFSPAGFFRIFSGLSVVALFGLTHGGGTGTDAGGRGIQCLFADEGERHESFSHHHILIDETGGAFAFCFFGQQPHSVVSGLGEGEESEFSVSDIAGNDGKSEKLVTGDLNQDLAGRFFGGCAAGKTVEVLG